MKYIKVFKFDGVVEGEEHIENIGYVMDIRGGNGNEGTSFLDVLTTLEEDYNSEYYISNVKITMKVEIDYEH